MTFKRMLLVLSLALLYFALPQSTALAQEDETPGTTVYLPVVGNSNANQDPVGGEVSLNFEGLTYMQLPFHTQGGPTEAASLDVSYFLVDENRLNLKGQVQYNDTVYSIDLDGSLHNALVGGTSDKVVAATDLDNNFNVIRFSLRQDPVDDFVFFEENTEGVVLFLYLQLKGTRELTTIEATLKGTEAEEIASQIVAGAWAEDELGGSFWRPRIFEPISTSLVTDTPPDLVIAQSIDGIDQTASDYQTASYSVDFQRAFGCVETHVIQFAHGGNSVSNLPKGGEGSFQFTFEFLQERVDSNCAAYRFANFSVLEIGKSGDPLKVRTRVYGNNSNVGDIIKWQDFDARNTADVVSPFKDVSISVGFDLAYVGVSWDKALCCSQTRKDNQKYDFIVANPNGTAKITEFAFTDRLFRQKGHLVATRGMMGHGGGPRNGSAVCTRWKIPIYERLNNSSVTRRATATRYNCLNFTSG